MHSARIPAAVLAASLALAMPAEALAQGRVITGNDRNLPASAVDTSRTNSLLVRKVATNPYDDVPAGEKPPAIAGARFTISRVKGIDITTEEGRERAKSMTLDDAKGLGLTKVATGTTDADGRVDFENLQSGLYLIEETAPDTAYQYHLSSPRLMLLPLANVSGTEFNYENVVVMKWDNESGVPPWKTSTPPSSTPASSTRPSSPSSPGTTTEPITEKTTERATDRVTEKTTSFKPVESTITSTLPNGSTTVITTRPSTYVTTQPNGSVTTVTQPSDGGRRDGGLAETGANVLWAAGLGGLLILLGFVMARQGRNETTR